jgi:zinc transport system substrate-binding protein
MSARFRAALATLAAAGLLCAGCGARDGEGEAGAALRATASLPPVAGIVRAIGGEPWAVDSLVGPGQDPHAYEPTPHQIAALASSGVFFRTGMPFEDALAARIAAAYPGVRIVSLAPREHHGEELAHGHAHDEAAVHGWLSPHNLEAWARAIADELAAADSAGADAAAGRLAAWLDALEREEEATRAAVAGAGVRAFVAWHPAYGAWAADFGLEQIALEADGKAPGPRTLAAARERIAGTGAKVLLAQSGAEAARADAFARDAGLRVAVVPPLADDPLATLRALREAVLAAPPGNP